jgi:hypothetical protein
LYDDKRKAKPDPELRKYIEKARNISGVANDPKVLSLLFSLTACSFSCLSRSTFMDPNLK